MRRGILLAAVALAACSRGGAAPKVAEGSEHIDCALGAGAGFAPECAVERSTDAGRQVLVVRHPDGAFRRLTVGADGVTTTDGAEPARVSASGGMLEVSVGADRYRIPFRVRAGGAG